MNLIFIDNINTKHDKYIKEILSSSCEAYIIVAFFKKSGLEIISHNIKNLIKENVAIKILIGLDMYITDPEALLELYSIVKNNNNCEFFIYKSITGNFHPKIYAGKSGENFKAIIGSANLTGGGLLNNIEASTFINSKNNALYCSITKSFSDLTKSQNAKIANLLNLYQYEKDHQTYSAKIKDAHKEATKEIKENFTLDLDNLEYYASEYLKNRKIKKEFNSRMENYAEAENILNTMLKKTIQNSDDFLEYYGLLVGAAGKGQLWHSGSINRLKTRVARNHKLFIKMLKDLKNNIGIPPKEIFSIASPYVNKIDGLGYNVVTEILSTYSPDKYPILNNNPLGSIRYLGFSGFKDASRFNEIDYQNYTDFMLELSKELHFENLLRVDHFLNHIYWKYVKNS